MEDKVKNIIVTIGLMIIGVYARIYLGNDKRFSFWQILALIAVGVALVTILNKSSIADVYKMSLTLFYGLVSPNFIHMIIKIGEKSEEKAADKISKKITDNIP